MTKGDHVLWNFGRLAPLPERVIGEVQLVLSSGASASIKGGPITMFRLYREFRRVERLHDYLRPDCVIHTAGAC